MTNVAFLTKINEGNVTNLVFLFDTILSQLFLGMYTIFMIKLHFYNIYF